VRRCGPDLRDLFAADDNVAMLQQLRGRHIHHGNIVQSRWSSFRSALSFAPSGEQKNGN
jgi:hypothetical protein